MSPFAAANHRAQQEKATAQSYLAVESLKTSIIGNFGNRETAKPEKDCLLNDD
jgi:hypothetical protein